MSQQMVVSDASLEKSGVNQFLVCFRFVPYIGIVTILMNDYPKFKVRMCPISCIKNVILCLIVKTIK